VSGFTFTVAATWLACIFVKTRANCDRANRTASLDPRPVQRASRINHRFGSSVELAPSGAANFVHASEFEIPSARSTRSFASTKPRQSDGAYVAMSTRRGRLQISQPATEASATPNTNSRRRRDLIAAAHRKLRAGQWQTAKSPLSPDKH